MLIRPVLENTFVLWILYKQSEIQELEAVQKKAVRFICDRYNCDFSLSFTLSSLQLTPVHSPCWIESLKFLLSIVYSTAKLSNNKEYRNFTPESTTTRYHNFDYRPYYAWTNYCVQVELFSPVSLKTLIHYVVLFIHAHCRVL